MPAPEPPRFTPTFTLPPQLLAEVDRRMSHDMSYDMSHTDVARGPHEVIRRDLARYYTVLEESRAELVGSLTIGEWAAMCEAVAHITPPSVAYIPTVLKEALQAWGLDAKYQIAAVPLGRQLRRHSAGALACLLDAIERFLQARDGAPFTLEEVAEAFADYVPDYSHPHEATS